MVVMARKSARNAQARQPDDHAEESRHQHGQRQREQERHAGLAQERRGVGADAEEGGVSEADLSAEPGDEIQRQREQDADADGGD